MAFQDIATPAHRRNGDDPAAAPSVEPSGPLTDTEIRQSTLCFTVSPEQCYSFTACPICMQDFADGDVGITLRCFHIFHAACARQWLQQSGNCPVCRVRVHVDADEAASPSVEQPAPSANRNG